ncbi:MAG: FAD-dependent oxidoreductase [Clostridiaceae bacterium]
MQKMEKRLDLIIIGAGMAGLTAAIYASRAKISTLVLEDELIGGQVREAYSIENYPGFINISGEELTERLQKQARETGAEIDEFDKIKTVILTDKEKIIETDSFIYKPSAVILATGSRRIKLPVPEERKFHGRGIHYCETCDGSLYLGKHLVVIGGGNSAVGSIKFLSKYAEKITLIHKGDKLKADKKNQDEVLKNPKVTVILNSVVIHANGDSKLEFLTIENIMTKEITELKADGVFSYIGFAPRTELYRDYIKLNGNGNIEAGENCETNIKGVFAAGDVRTKRYHQLTTASSDGTVAALMAEEYILSK